MRFVAPASFALAIVGLALAISGTAKLLGTVMLLAGLGLGLLAAGVSLVLRTRRAIHEWTSILSGGVRSIRVVGLEPPRGMIFSRAATITLAVVGRDGTERRVEREMTVPIPQAILWKLAGRVPSPLRRLGQARAVDVALYEGSEI